MLFYNATGSSMSKDAERRPPAAGGLGFMLVALVVGFTVVGYYMDRWLHTKPWLMVGGVFVGAGLGFFYMVLVLFADSSRKRKGKKSPSEDQGPDRGES